MSEGNETERARRMLRKAYLVVHGTTDPKDKDDQPLGVGEMTEQVVAWLLAERRRSAALERKVRRLDAAVDIIRQEVDAPLAPDHVDVGDWRCTICNVQMDPGGDPAVFVGAHDGCFGQRLRAELAEVTRRHGQPAEVSA